MEPVINDDVATEILSRLPIKSLLAFKCVSKRWNEIISDTAFLHIHYKNSYEIVGFFLVFEPHYKMKYGPISPLGFVPLVENKSRLISPPGFLPLVGNKSRLSLDFLPEKVIPVASSNGLICCRTYKYSNVPLLSNGHGELHIYLCDLTRREWITISPPRGLSFDDPLVFGLASYPFGTSSNQAPSFKLVNIQPLRNDVLRLDILYSIVIYSSDTRRWKKSIIVRTCDPIREDMAIFTNGSLHWSTENHHCMITFDVENETSKVILLPCYAGEQRQFGESGGYLHYICLYSPTIRIWVLKDYGEAAWELKHDLKLPSFCLQNLHPFRLWSYYNEVLVLTVDDVALSYDFKTGRVIKHYGFKVPKKGNHIFARVIQCHANLIPLQNYVGHDFVCRKPRRRRTILPR